MVDRIQATLKGTASFFIGLKITWINFWRPAITVQYPDELPDFAPRYRGLHGLTYDPEAKAENCIGCLACARVCPDNLISMTLEKREGHKGRYPINFQIDLNPCCFCGLCAEVCPTPMKALVMTKEFELASSSRRDLILDKAWLMENGRKEVEKYGLTANVKTQAKLAKKAAKAAA